MSLEKTITTKEEVKKKKKDYILTRKNIHLQHIFQTQLHEHTTTVNAS